MGSDRSQVPLQERELAGLQSLLGSAGCCFSHSASCLFWGLELGPGLVWSLLGSICSTVLPGRLWSR